MRNRALKYTILFALVGTILSLLIGYVERDTVRTYESNLPYIRLGENVKNNTTEAHLWLEEILSGEVVREYNRDVLGKLNASRAILQSAYDGQKTDLGTFAKITDEETKATLKEAIVGIDKLVESAQERYKMHQQSMGADSAMAASAKTAETSLDEGFDQSYDAFQKIMDRLVEHINQKLAAETKFLNIIA